MLGIFINKNKMFLLLLFSVGCFSSFSPFFCPAPRPFEGHFNDKILKNKKRSVINLQKESNRNKSIWRGLPSLTDGQKKAIVSEIHKLATPKVKRILASAMARSMVAKQGKNRILRKHIRSLYILAKTSSGLVSADAREAIVILKKKCDIIL